MALWQPLCLPSQQYLEKQPSFAQSDIYDASMASTVDSDRSSASHVSVLHLLGPSSQQPDPPEGPVLVGAQLPPLTQPPRFQQLPIAAADAGGLVSAANVPEGKSVVPSRQRNAKCHGYRKLWALVHSLQPGERLRASGHKEEVTVSLFCRVETKCWRRSHSEWQTLFGPAVVGCLLLPAPHPTSG